ncbi:rho GTPase-activating protein 45-like isoform X2 [Ornithodoros turicata]|uniref:rho GTPase-activating protein 45-like isoform X2 n=1 Tax=Ornithodoros turicata TaxID=34597 RepID=UPI00313980A5
MSSRKKVDGASFRALTNPNTSRRASLPYRNVMDLAKALCKTCRQRRASYAAGVIIALPGIIQTLQPEDRVPGSGSALGPDGAPQHSPHSRSGSGASSAALGGGGASVASSASSGDDEAGGTSSTAPPPPPAVVEREDILVLTHDVRGFKEALGRLRKIFHPDYREKQETMRVAAHERLGEVLRILRSILEKYPPIQSTELLMAAGTLIQHVKGHSYGSEEKSESLEFFEAIDQLALAFSSRVSEYLMGDLDTSINAVSKTRSCDNLLSPDKDSDGLSRMYESSALTGQQVDSRLMRISEGVELSLKRAKVWSKYAKDVMTYVEKRANLEAEHARNLLKLAQTMRPVLKEESFLPFQSIYCTAIDQDLDNANNCLSNCTLLHDHKFVEPLSARRNEHEKMRKQLKEMWQRELKKMQECETNVRKARALYIQRQQEHDKAKESAQRAEAHEGTDGTGRSERKRRLEDDALQRARDAETTYKACVVEANERLLALERVKAEVLQQVRELICQCDQTMKAVTVAYFQLQHTVSAPSPVQFQTLCESSRLYEPGSQYMEYIKRIPIPLSREEAGRPQLFTFEPYATDARSERDRRYNDGTENVDDSFNHASGESRLDARSKRREHVQEKHTGGGSDSDSSCPSNKSVDTSPTASPQIPTRTLLTVSSGDELDTDHDNDSGLGLCRKMCLSRAAETHSFRKLRTPSRCRECDSYVYFQGVECLECGLSSHKKCLETLAIQCGHKRLPRKMTTFGVDLTDHTDEANQDVPFIVRKCIDEIDRRGYMVKGIYRVSGVKSKVEKLCQCFENGADLVDLADVHPNVVANVLKLYLRQLPEPLLTYKLYPDFISIAKEHLPGREGDEGALLGALKRAVRALPSVHQRTLSYLLQHLRRVADHSALNNMPASNLGIVFGPTLLRTSEGSASLSSLVDTVHQTRVIELLITYADQIFGSETDDASGMMEGVSRRSGSLGLATSPSRLLDSKSGSPLSRTVSAASQTSDDWDERLTGGSSPVSHGIADDLERLNLDDIGRSSDKWHAEMFEEDTHSEGRDAHSPRSFLGCTSHLEHEFPPVPPPRRGGSGGSHSPRERSMEVPSSQDDDDDFTSIASITLSAQKTANAQQGSKPTNVAELRRQFFEAPSTSSSLEELRASQTSSPKVVSPAVARLLSSARTSSEPQLSGCEAMAATSLPSALLRDTRDPVGEAVGRYVSPFTMGGGSGRSSLYHWSNAAPASTLIGSGTSSLRGHHAPLRESVSLKKHWYSTEENSQANDHNSSSSFYQEFESSSMVDSAEEPNGVSHRSHDRMSDGDRRSDGSESPLDRVPRFV